MNNDNYDFTIAFDLKKMRVGCVLIQTALGATIPRALFHKYFPVEMWDVASSGMRVFKTKRDELPKLAEMIQYVLNVEKTWEE